MQPTAPGTPTPEPSRNATREGEDEARAGEGTERFGPLVLTRIHKDDGRELIFYSQAREPA
jgi:hypothetical protein